MDDTMRQISSKKRNPHHILGCKNRAGVDAPAFYEPSFYSVKINDSINVKNLFSKLRDRSQNPSKSFDLTDKEISTWIYFCHEYVHFLQDIRCAKMRYNALQRFKVAVGTASIDKSCEIENSTEELQERLQIKKCEQQADGTVAVTCYGHQQVFLSEHALAESIAITLEDRLWDIFNQTEKNQTEKHPVSRPLMLPYDLPLWIAEWCLGDSVPAQEFLKKIVLDVCEASLMTKSPARSFVDFFRSNDARGQPLKIDYDFVLDWFSKKGIQLCDEHEDLEFKNRIQDLFSTTQLSALADWVSSKTQRISECYQRNGIGLFRSMFEDRVFPNGNYVDQFVSMMQEVVYPVIYNDNEMYCAENDKDTEVQYLLPLITAYDIALCHTGIPCTMLPFCRGGMNPTINKKSNTAPRVSDYCQVDPTQVDQGKRYSCPFQIVWGVHEKNRKEREQ